MIGSMRKRLVAAAATVGVLAVAGGAGVLQPWGSARLAFLETLGVRVAEAQTRLKFTPVPEESAQAFEERATERRAARSAAMVSPAAATPPSATSHPAVPSAPESPTAPLPPSSTGNIVQIGSDIHIERGQVVDGDVLSINSDIRVDGHVRGNVSATRGDVTLGSTARVDGDVLCLGGSLHEEPGASVGGQRVTGLEGHERSARVRERIHDRIEGRLGRMTDDEVLDESGRAGGVLRSLLYLLMSAAFAWVIARFAAGRTQTALRSLQHEAGMSLGLGFLMVLLIVPSVVALALVVVVLCITIIGIPVALGVMLAYAGLLIVLGAWGAVVGYAALGQRIARGMGRPLPSVASAAVWGVVVVQGVLVVGRLLHMAPLLGGFGTLLHVLGIVLYSMIVLLGMGALVRSKFGQGPNGRWWPLQYLFGSLPVSAVPPVPAGSAAYWPAGDATSAAPPIAPAPAPIVPPPSSYAPPAIAPPPADASGLSASTPPSGITPMIVPPPSAPPPPSIPPPSAPPPPGDPPPSAPAL